MFEKSKDDTCYIAQQRKGKHGAYYEYASVKDARWFVEILKGVAAKDRNFYELLTADSKTRLYLDVEWFEDPPADDIDTSPDSSWVTDTMRSGTNTLQDILEGFRDTIDEPAMTGDINVTIGSRWSTRADGSKAFKHSYHVVFPRVYFETHDQGMRHWVKKTVSALPCATSADGTCRVDLAVYTKNRAMRIFGCCKLGSTVALQALMIDDDYTIEFDNMSTNDILGYMIKPDPVDDNFIVYSNEDVGYTPKTARAPRRKRKASELTDSGISEDHPDNDDTWDMTERTAPLRAALERKLVAFGYVGADIFHPETYGYTFRYDHVNHAEPLDLPFFETFHTNNSYVKLDVDNDVVTVGTHSPTNKYRNSGPLCTYSSIHNEINGVQKPLFFNAIKCAEILNIKGKKEAFKYMSQNVHFVKNNGKPTVVMMGHDGRDCCVYLHLQRSWKRDDVEAHPILFDDSNNEKIALEDEIATIEAALAATDPAPSTEGKRQQTAKRKRATKKLTAEMDRLANREKESITLPALAQEFSATPGFSYNTMVFRPDLPYPDAGSYQLNQFRGYAAERLLPKYPDRYPDEIAPWLWHVRHILCSDHEELYNYVLNWYLWPLSHPKRKIGSALVLLGKPGCGKGASEAMIQATIGAEYCITVGDNSSLTGQFNGHMANKLWIHASELDSGGAAFCHANALKRLITDEVGATERKGIDRVKDFSIASIVMISNELEAVRVANHDRRYQIVEVSDDKIGDKAYFDILAKTTRDPKAQVELYRMAQERKAVLHATQFSGEDNIIPTRARNRLQLSGLDVTTAFFLNQLLETNMSWFLGLQKLNGSPSPDLTWPLLFTASEVWGALKMFAEDQNCTRECDFLSERKLSTRLASMFGDTKQCGRYNTRRRYHRVHSLAAYRLALPKNLVSDANFDNNIIN
ncbi:MAG: hypothetical protein COB29_01200 [Sulfitobacter sp.]|nr:MAG: hypothetical protein COB29_01200 [Sulfitobacter sp.]